MAKHNKTLEAIYRKPTSPTIVWKDIESLFVSLGAEITEGAGSRVIIELNGCVQVFHRPHPRKETDKGAVNSVRNFLDKANK